MKKIFNPETVVWTDNMVENTDPAYSRMDPNAAKEKTGYQNPYRSHGNTFNGWEYSEYLWTHAYPIGNGRMGGMVAGAVDKEIIQLNEDTVWSGSPYADLADENGRIIANSEFTDKDAIVNAKRITAVNQTGGSVAGGWRYFRGADGGGNPAPIGSAATVGDEAFREKYPEFAGKSLSMQALNVNNALDEAAVTQRFNMERMVEHTFLGFPHRQKVFKSFVEVYLDFGHSHKNVTDYTKSLDMQTGTVTVDYLHNGTRYTRESFISYPEQAAVTHITSDGELDFTAELHTYHNQVEGAYKFEKVGDNQIKLTARVTDGGTDCQPAGPNVIRFEARMIIQGCQSSVISISDDCTTVSVKGGKEAAVYVVGATNFVDYLNIDNEKPSNDCEKYAANLADKTYDIIKQRHIADFSPLFNRTSLSLGNANGADNAATATERRVRKDIDGVSGFKTGAGNSLKDAAQNGVTSTYADGDNQLAVLEFNFGKYILIAGSRAENSEQDAAMNIRSSQPLTLAGRWNASRSASWGGKYTININTEMNYWAAQPLNLPETEIPLIETFADIAQGGAITAANQYAVYNERGDNRYEPGDPWVIHHNYDLWRGTMPIDNATAGLWPTGGIWLLDHAWQFYRYTLDADFLAKVYPFIHGAAAFFTQFLVLDPVTGYLVTAASCSPEQGGVQPGPAMDTQLIRNLYDTFRKSTKILGKEKENEVILRKIDEQMPSAYFADEKGKLAPNLIDGGGLIQEWARGDVTFDIGRKSENPEWTLVSPFNGEVRGAYAHEASNRGGHRHCSHLWELFPGKHLNAYSDDANERSIFKAYQKTVAAKGPGSGQGWGLAWRINLNARALDGEAASEMLNQLLTTRTSPNLFDQHPNFQIDGNYGATSGVIEMVMQSHSGCIHLLPAIPASWQTGSFKGFKAIGGAVVDCEWQGGKPVSVTVTPKIDGEIKVRFGEKVIVFNGKAGVAEQIRGF